MTEPLDWTVERGLLAADQEIDAFRLAVLERSDFSAVTRLHSRSQQVFRAEVGGIPCILKIARHVRAAATVRHTNAFHRVARGLSPQRMSSPAALIRFPRSHSGVPANTNIVAIQSGPPTYSDGGKVGRDVVVRIDNEVRHLGAFLAFIAHLSDHGVLRNLLFSTAQTDEFPFWFIDLDFAFGATMWWGHGKSVFFPGCELGYQPQRSASSAPALANELLGFIDRLTRQDLARIFGLSPGEAADLQSRCCAVEQFGLEQAIERERFWTPADGLLTCWKQTAYAKLVFAYRALLPEGCRCG
jgi:hypothetical protein